MINVVVVIEIAILLWERRVSRSDSLHLSTRGCCCCWCWC